MAIAACWKRAAHLLALLATASLPALAALPRNTQCSQRGGTCNPITGQCLCPFGRTGPTCAEVLFPACRKSLDDNALISCDEGLRLPRACECWRQCVSHFCDGDLDAFSLKCRRLLPRDIPCFERPGVPAFQQLSNIPGPEEIEAGKVVWLATYRQGSSGASGSRSPANSTARDVLSLGAPQGWHAVPEEECGDSGCNGAGICQVFEPGGHWSSPQRRRLRRRLRREAGDMRGAIKQPQVQPKGGIGSSTSSTTSGTGSGASGGAPSTARCACERGFAGKDCQPVQSPTDASCPLACSGRGVCKQGHCQCQQGSWGPGCAYNSSAWQPLPATQIAQCTSPLPSRPLRYQPDSVSLPGAVRKGGMLDALRSLPSLVERLSRKPEGLRIWVYPLPTDLAWYPIWPRVESYAAEHLFIERLLADAEVLAQDPACAHLYLVPALSTYVSGNAAWRSAHQAQITSILVHVRDSYPFYNRSGGADHFVWATGDLGAVRWGTANQLLAPIIKVSHFGYDHTSPLASPPFKGTWLGFSPSTDIVAMGHDGPRLALLRERSSLAGDLYNKWHTKLMAAVKAGGLEAGLAAARELLGAKNLKMFFSGSLNWMGFKDKAYSLGVRQALNEWAVNFTAQNCAPTAAASADLKAAVSGAGGAQTGHCGAGLGTGGALTGHLRPNATGPVQSAGVGPPTQGGLPAIQDWLVSQSCQGMLLLTQSFGTGVRALDVYLAAVSSSIFCPSPPGWGWTVRTATAVEFGCIPVILQDAIVQPGEGDLLPYDLFSLRFSLADIESGRMWQKLVELTSTDAGRDQLAGMLLALAHVRKFFIWSKDLDGHAYELTLHELAQRASRLAKL